MNGSPVRVESATHLDRPREAVFAVAHHLLASGDARVVVSDPPRHVRAESHGPFGTWRFDELWLEEWGDGTGVRYKGGVRAPAGWIGRVLLSAVARRAADARSRRFLDALRAALQL